MKRYIYVLLALLLLLTGCSRRKPDSTVTTAAPLKTLPTLGETTLPETTAGASLEKQVIYDAGGIVITVTGLQEDWMGTKVNLLVENSTDRNIALSGDVFAVNGVTVPGYLYAEAAAGMKTNDSLELYSDALETANITRIATIRTGDARIVDTDSFDILARVNMDLVTDVGPGYQQGIDDSGEELFEEEDITVIAQVISEELYGKTVRLLVKNDTDKDIIVEAENISVNGFTLDAWLYEKILADTVRYCALDLFSGGLEENGIAEIEKVTFQVKVLNAQNLDTILKSEQLEVYVAG